MRQLTSRIAVAIAVTGLLIAVLGCSHADQQESNDVTLFSVSKINEYGDAVESGYNLLGEGNLDSAVAVFGTLAEIIPEGKYNEYHIACAYSRTGHTDKAIQWLQKAVDRGFDSPQQLLEDSDLKPLADNPEFKAIVDRARRNVEASAPTLGAGLPEYDNPPEAFATLEELQTWYDEQNLLVRQNSRVLFDVDYIAAKTDLIARYLAALRSLAADSAGFDYGLERVRRAGQVISPFECWGPYANSVLKEFDRYMATEPSEAGAGEARFWAGLALSLRHCDESEATQREADLAKANSYLEQVDEAAGEYYYPARTLILANELEMDPANESDYGDEVREVLTASMGNPWVGRIVSTRFQNDAVRMIWPIPFDAQDIDGKPVKWSDYSNKVVLVDFWATWCAPCLAELPHMVEAYNDYHDKGLEIVSISLDYSSNTSPEDYRRWIKDNGMSWRHVYDGRGWQTPLTDKYFVKSIPAPFMIGRDGKVFASGEACRGEALAETIKRALGNGKG